MLVILFVLTSIAFIQLDNRQALDPAKDALQTVVAPITNALSGVGSSGDGNSRLARELEQTRAERDAFARENAALKANQAEIDQLREQAGLQQQHQEWQLLQARVINPDPANLNKFITIDKGRDEGVERGMAVVARGSSYVGLVTDVTEHSARVVLLIDQSQTVGARLEAGADGVVKGMWQRGGRLVLEYVNRDVPTKKGDLVLTADSEVLRTARVPGGLLIGRVEEPGTKNPQSDSQTIKVLPLVDYEALSVVTVVLRADGA